MTNAIDEGSPPGPWLREGQDLGSMHVCGASNIALLNPIMQVSHNFILFGPLNPTQ
jgi:hypothetical protein